LAVSLERRTSDLLACSCNVQTAAQVSLRRSKVILIFCFVCLIRLTELKIKHDRTTIIAGSCCNAILVRSACPFPSASTGWITSPMGVLSWSFVCAEKKKISEGK
jgi:hypothetical protein